MIKHKLSITKHIVFIDLTFIPLFTDSAGSVSLLHLYG